MELLTASTYVRSSHECHGVDRIGNDIDNAIILSIDPTG